MKLDFLELRAISAPVMQARFAPLLAVLICTGAVASPSSRTVPPYLAVAGEAAADANIAVQAKKPQRKGTAFWREWSVDNATSPVRENVRVAAANPGGGSNGADLINVETGKLYLPPATENFTYDDDGNLIGDSRWTYSWDAENRLLSMQENSATLPTGWTRQRLEFSYDAGSRRVRKAVKQWDGSAWQTISDTGFVYDGWNLIAEVNILQPSSSSPVRSYCWGLDLSQSLQGAGGVGGLLWVVTYLPSAICHLPSYDGNGNVIGYLDAASGLPVLKLDYDPFGNVVMAGAMGDPASGAVARSIPFQFSTKYLDAETGLSYYGYRYYSAERGRWINRDPIGRRGGSNLYGMAGNDLLDHWDLRGLCCPGKRRNCKASEPRFFSKESLEELDKSGKLAEQIKDLEAASSAFDAVTGDASGVGYSLGSGDVAPTLVDAVSTVNAIEAEAMDEARRRPTYALTEVAYQQSESILFVFSRWVDKKTQYGPTGVVYEGSTATVPFPPNERATPAEIARIKQEAGRKGSAKGVCQ